MSRSQKYQPRFRVSKGVNLHTECPFRHSNARSHTNSTLCSFCMMCFHILKVRLVYCNGYYTIIGINITKNKKSCNVITTIHLFGDYT